jgi:hypothetical protein
VSEIGDALGDLAKLRAAIDALGLTAQPRLVRLDVTSSQMAELRRTLPRADGGASLGALAAAGAWVALEIDDDLPAGRAREVYADGSERLIDVRAAAMTRAP